MLGRKMLAKNSVYAAEKVEGFREIRGGARRRLLLASFRKDACAVGETGQRVDWRRQAYVGEKSG
jgi:hypothetical protein